jgi:uncharacterized membrane protein YgcG
MNERDISPPEDSIALRLVVFAMTLICIGASCLFIKTSWPIMVMGITLASIGSLVAYQYRHDNQKWMQLIVIVGVFGVGANALSEFMNPVNGPADFWGPVVHFVAGTFALHTFDLKTRSDINLSALLGALILCFISPINKSIYFGGAVLAYVILGTAMLFFDCMSRTQSNWLDKPMNPAPVLPQFSAEKGRRPSGSAQLTLASLPLISMIFFLLVPRSDATMDLIVSTFHNFDMNKLMRFLPNFAVEQKAPKAARNPYSPPVRNLGTGVKEHKVDKDKDKEKSKPPTPAKEEKASGKSPEKAPPKPKQENEDKSAGLKPADAKDEKAKKDNTNKDKKAADKDNSDSEKSGKAEDSDKSSKAAGGKKDKKAPLDKKALAEQAAKDAADALSKLGKDGLSKQAAKDAADALKKIGKDGKGGGQGGANGSGKGGKGDKGGKGGQGSEPNPYGPGQSPLSLDDFDLDAHYVRNEDLFLKVTSSRLFFLRRAVFDNFNGRLWSRSKDSIKPKDIAIASLTSKPESSGEPQPELSPEEQAAKELEDEKLRSLDGQLSGFGAKNAVHFVFSKPEKPSYDLIKANAFIVPKILPSVDLTQSYEVVADIGDVVPVCWIPQTLGYGGRTVTVDDYGQIKGSEPIKKGSTYKVISQLPLYDIAAMKMAPPLTPEQEAQIRENLANYLQIPETVSPEVIDFANESVGDSGNWFTQAERLCHVVRLQANYEAEKPSDYEPQTDRVKQFLLERRLGNSKDFASAYAVLCRAVGLPSRCVTGFGYGTNNKVSGVREIRGKDAYTWTEVFIPDYGWVPFDPAPEGMLPAQVREEGYSIAALQRFIEEKLGMNLTDSEGMSPKRIISWIALIMTALFMFAGVIYGLILLWRWWRRNKHANRYKGPAWKVFAGVLKELKTLKIERHECETLQQFEGRVRLLVKDRIKKGLATDRDLPDALSDFFAVYRAAQFGEKQVMSELKTRAQDVKKLVKSKGK